MEKAELREPKMVMPLSLVAPGQKVTLVRVDAGHGLQGRLTAMGLVPGKELEVVQSGSCGPITVAVDESRIMLGRGMAHKILVG